MSSHKYFVSRALHFLKTVANILGVIFVALFIVTLCIIMVILQASVNTDEDTKLPEGRTNIFFIETRCPKDRIGSLKPRQACSIESAANQNPDWKVFVYFLNIDSLVDDPCMKVLQSLPNVHFRLINAVEFARGTPTEELLKKGLKTHPEWLISHTSDVLRYTTLYKYAGVYMDLDIISLKSLNELAGNFAGQEVVDKNITAGAGVVGFSDDEVGRKMAQLVAQDVAENFTGDDWSANGLGTLSRGISKQCGTHLVAKATENACNGFKLYPRETFYAISFYQNEWYFDSEYYQEGMKALEKSVVAHLWNFLSSKAIARRGSQTVICEIAQKYCPRTFEIESEFCL